MRFFLHRLTIELELFTDLLTLPRCLEARLRGRKAREPAQNFISISHTHPKSRRRRGIETNRAEALRTSGDSCKTSRSAIISTATNPSHSDAQLTSWPCCR